MSAHETIAPLPRFWRWLFLIEIPLTAVTLAIWIVQPHVYLHDMIGITAPQDAELFLLRLYAGSVTSLVLSFYFWLLLKPTVHLPTFRVYQICLGIGDVFVVAASLAYWSTARIQPGLILQIVLALFWGSLRIVFLIRTRR